MNNAVKKAAAVVAAIIFMCCPTLKASAKEMYDVYNYDRWDEAIPSQAGYIAESSISGSDLGIGDFSEPGDIFISEDGLFYIADTGNNRVVVLDSELKKSLKIIDKFVYEGKNLELKKPSGIFVSDKNNIYIADTENSRVIKCDSNGEVSLIIERPDSVLYTAGTFLPQKVIVDSAGYIYIIVNNVTSGSLMYDSSGKFAGFYGANRVQTTGQIVKNYFWKLLANENMRRYMTDSVPAPVTNFDIDNEGFVYTCNESLTQDLDAIKKLNAAGYNLFADIDAEFGDKPTADYSDMPSNSYVDIDVNSEGFINCLDYSTGRIFQYDEDCNLLFVIGSLGNQLGTFRHVTAIESTSDSIFVADSQKNTITVFKETAFGKIVHKATVLYNDGYYNEALEPWFEVLKRDGNYRRAFMGIASAYINQGNYSDAMKYAKLADSKWLYNRAFEGWRTEFLYKYFVYIIIAIAAVLISIAYLLKKLKKKGKEVPEKP